MPSAYNETEKSEGGAAQREITSALASLASRPTGAPTGKRQLKGPERAAVLMLALGEQHGAKIWGMLDDDELRQISVVMSTIGTIEAELVENLLLEHPDVADAAVLGMVELSELAVPVDVYPAERLQQQGAYDEILDRPDRLLAGADRARARRDPPSRADARPPSRQSHPARP